MPSRVRAADRGSLRADQFQSGDPYELSHGHLISCAPTGGSGSGPNRLGASVLGWDPKVKEAGVDTGYEPVPDVLRAPDVAIGNVPNKPGWVKGVPALAIEYADVGQDERKLEEKIRDLLAYGTRFLWVVRLAGPRRVEVHERGKKTKTVFPGAFLSAPGVLQNPVLVEALYDQDEAQRATLRNLLQRAGYEDLDAVLAAGRREGLQEGLEKGIQEGLEKGIQEGLEKGRIAALLTLLDARGLRVGKDAREQIEGCTRLDQLDKWIRRAATIRKTSELFEDS